MSKKAPIKLRILFDQDSDLLEKAFHAMSASLDAYIEGNEEEKEKKAHETIKIEKEQDALRSKMIERLFSKETMVFSRMDRLKIIEQMDKIVDECEIVVRKLLQFNPSIPLNIKEKLRIITKNNAFIGTELKLLIQTVFDDFSKTSPHIKQITDLRREIREIHWQLLEENYKINKNFLEFSYLRDLIKSLAKVADRGEEFADQIFSFICKYSL
ncbi:MAG: DUF47 family protein [Candidatus Lokiarchaeota archaeon]|nr:DUF47 family protein [Candidatus Harpocratesius repetitus]